MKKKERRKRKKNICYVPTRPKKKILFSRESFQNNKRILFSFIKVPSRAINEYYFHLLKYK